METLYVYYRVAAEHGAQAGQRVRAWQAALRAAHAGLETQLQQRTEPQAPGQITLLETYRAAASALDARLRTHIGAGPDLGGCLAGERRVESFVDVD